MPEMPFYVCIQRYYVTEALTFLLLLQQNANLFLKQSKNKGNFHNEFMLDAGAEQSIRCSFCGIFILQTVYIPH